MSARSGLYVFRRGIAVFTAVEIAEECSEESEQFKPGDFCVGGEFIPREEFLKTYIPFSEWVEIQRKKADETEAAKLLEQATSAAEKVAETIRAANSAVAQGLSQPEIQEKQQQMTSELGKYLQLVRAAALKDLARKLETKK